MANSSQIVGSTENPSPACRRLSISGLPASSWTASTRADDAAPRQLRREEKALFDLSDQLRTARETNRGEAVVRRNEFDVDDELDSRK